MNKLELLSDKRVNLFVGEYGSGKTELAANYAIHLQRIGHPAAIVDIDLVKPYFRTRENRSVLEKEGVLVIAPESRLAHADLPILPQNLTRVLADRAVHVVMDAGGGESAIALAQIQPQLFAAGYEAFLVVNICRPFTNTVEGIIAMTKRIEQATCLSITGLISNSNLAEETTIAQVETGLNIAENAAYQLGISVRAVAVPDWLAGVQLSKPVFPIKRYTQYPWME